ncbi:MAG TPA: hypothetical protein VIJ73_13030 [Methylomirabilota bacterium]
MERSKRWEGLAFRPLGEPGREARELFTFVGAWAPPSGDVVAGWGAWDGDALVGAILVERAGQTAMLHGPAVASPPGGDPESAVDGAAGLVALALAWAETEKVETLFARPQSLDRVWVRFGFIPVPEVELPQELKKRPGIGLFGWRGGSALWSAAGRGRDRRVSPARR